MRYKYVGKFERSVDMNINKIMELFEATDFSFYLLDSNTIEVFIEYKEDSE